MFEFTRMKGDRLPVDVSVIIPVYNHERFIAEAIESAAVQTVQPREILCIDDGSTDHSLRRIEAVATRHPMVRFWSRSNRGAASTLNEGLRAAAGEYVSILNSDDLYRPARLARCLAVLEADPAVAVVATDIEFVDGEGRGIPNAWYEEACSFHREIGDLGLALVNGNFLMTTSNIVARRSLFAEIGDFDDLRYAHDLDFFLRLVVHRKKLTLLRQPLLAYRFHGSNTITEGSPRLRMEWAAVAAFFARRLATARDPERGRPAYSRRLFQVTDRHELTRLIAQVLLHCESRNVPSPAACLADADLVASLQDSAA